MGQVRSVMTLLLRSIAMAISTCRVEEAPRRMHRPAFFSRRGRQDRIAGAQGGRRRAWAVGV